MKKELLTSSGYRVLAVIAAAIMLLCLLVPAQGQFTAYGTENEQADDAVQTAVPAETEGEASLAPQASVKDKWGERIPALTPLLSGNDDGGGYSPDPPAANLEAINAFVERLYTVVLDRASDPEKASHVNALAAHAINGAQAAEGFFFSDEMNKRGLSDEQWIDICYRTFLDREADAGGRQNWLNALASGASRYFVFAGFVGSDEFSGICASYGIDRGFYASPEPRDHSPAVRAFVYRLYEECLGRTPDPGGLNDWCEQLLSGKSTGTEVARGFFYSPEFESKYTTNTQIVTAAYKALLGRDPDPTGLADWVKRLDDGASKEVIFHGFGMSAEFKKICDAYGINQGTIADPDAKSDADFMIEADLELTGSGTGWHGKLVLGEGSAAISFGIQHDNFSALGYAGRDCLMFESIFPTHQAYTAVSAIGPGKHRIRLEWYRAQNIAKGYVDGQFVGQVATGLSQGGANRYFGVAASARLNGEKVDATFTNLNVSGIFSQGYEGHLESRFWDWNQSHSYHGEWVNVRIGTDTDVGFHLTGTAHIPSGGDWDSYPTVGTQARKEFTF